MSKKEFIRKVAANAGVAQAVADAVIAAAGKVVLADLQAGKEALVPGIAVVSVKDCAERPGRNPKTGEPCVVPAAKRLRARPAAKLVTKFSGGAESAADDTE